MKKFWNVKTDYVSHPAGFFSPRRQSFQNSDTRVCIARSYEISRGCGKGFATLS